MLILSSPGLCLKQELSILKHEDSSLWKKMCNLIKVERLAALRIFAKPGKVI
jgi:hypothetical protein